MNKLVNIPEKKLNQFESSASQIVETAKSLQVEKKEDVEFASEFLKKVKDSLKSIDDFRLSITRPLYHAQREVNDRFKELTNPMEEAKDNVTQKIVDWKNEQERKRKEAERRKKIQEAHEEKGHETHKEIKTPAKTPKTVGKAQIRERWDYKVKDFSKVPDKYKKLDKGKVRKAIRDKVRNISGLKIYKKKTVASV